MIERTPPLTRRRPAKAFDPREARDRRGRWTSGGVATENLYWHITHAKDFRIDPHRAPTEMSSIGTPNTDPGLMVTKDPHYWASVLHSHPDELGVEYDSQHPRRYAAEIDVSHVPPNEHWDVNRGFGHEHWINKPAAARVVRVLPLRKALSTQDARDAAFDRAVLARRGKAFDPREPRDAHGRWAKRPGGKLGVGSQVRITSGPWAGETGVIKSREETDPFARGPGHWLVRTHGGAEGLLRPDELAPANGSAPPARESGFRGHGIDMYFLGALPVPVGNQPPGGSDAKTPDEMRQYGDAVRDGVKRHPELAAGWPPVGEVTVRSDPEVSAEIKGVLGQNGVLLGTTSQGRARPQTIIINDSQPLDEAKQAKNLAPACVKPYGLMTHELGHAFAHIHIDSEPGTMTNWFVKFHISTLDVAKFSKYGLSSAEEAFGEMYAQEFTPGFQIEDPVLRDRFERMIREMRKKHRSMPAVAFETPAALTRHVTVVDGPIAAELERAAAENVKAGAWVAKTPLLDRLHRTLEGTAEQTLPPAGPRTAPERTPPLTRRRKAYDPHEERDWRGRWTTGPGVQDLLFKPGRGELVGSVVATNGASKSLVLPKGGKARKIAQETLPVIDRVLNLPVVEHPVQVKATAGTNKLGGLHSERTDGHIRPTAMTLSTANGKRPHLTLTHETGHLVDSEMLGTLAEEPGKPQRKLFGSLLTAARTSGGAREQWLRDAIDRQEHRTEWDQWWRAVQNSPEVKDHLSSAVMNDYAMHQYLLQPMELFARSFAQWIANASGDPKLRDELDAMRDPDRLAHDFPDQVISHRFGGGSGIPDRLLYRQWSDENFAPIWQALEKLMAAYGVRR